MLRTFNFPARHSEISVFGFLDNRFVFTNRKNLKNSLMLGGADADKKHRSKRFVLLNGHNTDAPKGQTHREVGTQSQGVFLKKNDSPATEGDGIGGLETVSLAFIPPALSKVRY